MDGEGSGKLLIVEYICGSSGGIPVKIASKENRNNESLESKFNYNDLPFHFPQLSAFCHFSTLPELALQKYVPAVMNNSYN